MSRTAIRLMLQIGLYRSLKSAQYVRTAAFFPQITAMLH
jgi:hypothetical protein